ncbi:tRNA-specific adenosine deaminase, partial [Salmonella enterica subsp. enterica]|nr:tRNA-specific adenosine deaminase [Salmonella enterica subsp. enterica]
MPSSFPMIPEPPSSTYPHEYWMAEAIREARK